jgi:3-oxoacyl-[acyl-carrier protein] reductase
MAVGRLAGKVAIVTGAGRGIGREHALLLAKEGASVLVNDTGLRREASPHDVVDEIAGAGGRAVADTASATWGTAQSIVDHAMDEFGRIDILINNANDNAGGNIWDFDEDGWDRTVEVHLKGYMAMMRAAVPHLAVHETASIVSTASGSGFGHPGFIAYAAAKEGVVGLTRTAAKELGRFGIRANAIRPVAAGPGTVEYAELMQAWYPLLEAVEGFPHPIIESESYRHYENSHPSSRIAPLVVWLCTDAARNVTGRTFAVGGDQIGLMIEPQERYDALLERPGGFDLDTLDDIGPTQLIQGLSNRWTLHDHPELQRFPG